MEFEDVNIDEIFTDGGKKESEGNVEYAGEDGRPYNEFETLGSKEYTDSDDEGNLVVRHKKDEGLSGTDIMKQLLNEYTELRMGEGLFEDSEGNEISARVGDGGHSLRMIPIDNLIFLGEENNRLRSGDLQLMTLQESIEMLGQLSPIHVVPVGNIVSYVKDDDTGEDIENLPIYSKYVVVDGLRRVEVYANLGFDTIEALVDTSLPMELAYFYQSVLNENMDLSFRDKMRFIKVIRELQPRISPDLLEASVGFKLGDLPKAEFIDAMQVDYPDIYVKLEKGKLTIEQAFKAIDKAISKKEKEMEEEALGLSGQDAEDALRDKQGNDLDELVRGVKKQELGNRHILEASVRRTVEARDGSKCQVCGYATGMPERASNLKAHHMVAVQYGGSDDPNNLIMLCSNCHEEVHKYESGDLIYSKDTYRSNNEVKKIVVLGNILLKAKGKAIQEIKSKDAALAKMMDRGKITVGRALLKGGIRINAEMDYEDGSPYKAYKEATKDLDFGGDTNGILGELGADLLGIDEPDEGIDTIESADDMDDEEATDINLEDVNTSEDIEVEDDNVGDIELEESNDLGGLE